MDIAALIFDLDGVLLDSEGVWDAARQQVARQNGGRWSETAQRDMMGMSSTEWAAYMHDELGVRLSPAQISDIVVARLEQLYRERLPLLPGARQTVIELAGHWPLGLASSANRPVIELFLELSRLKPCFAATASSEEVPRGKPAPDVYLETARRLQVAAKRCVAVEDSSNGIRSGSAAGMTVIAVPNRDFPPAGDTLGLAAAVLGSLEELTPDFVRQLSPAA